MSMEISGVEDLPFTALVTYRVELFGYIVGFDAEEMDQRLEFFDVVHHGCTGQAEAVLRLQ